MIFADLQFSDDSMINDHYEKISRIKCFPIFQMPGAGNLKKQVFSKVISNVFPP
jgi:hypothetical protein